MENVYDLANDLARGLKQSSEFKAFKQAEEKLKEDEKHLSMARDLMEKQQSLQMRQMMGEEIAEDEMNAFMTLQQTVMGIDSINDYFRTQMQFSIILNDIMKIIGDSIEMDDIFAQEEPATAEE